jgi:type IV secretory pathway VirB6-like protein
MLFAKKIKQILLLVFLVSTLASCDKECYEADQFYRKVKTIYANGVDANNRPERQRFGSYNDAHGGEVIEWKDTGMVASGDYFVIAVSGGWRDVGGSNITASEISKKDSCRLCFKNRSATETDNCICGPIFDDGKFDNDDNIKLKWENPTIEKRTTQGEENSIAGWDCFVNQEDDIDKCTCKNPNPITEKPIFFNDNKDRDFFSFSRDSIKKNVKYDSTNYERLGPDQRKDCAFKMGVGLYIGLVPKGDGVPPIAYHLASQQVVCPIELKKDGDSSNCKDKNGIDRSKFIYRSPNKKIFQKSSQPSSPFHEAGDAVKLNIYDNFLSDNAGRYNVEFMRGVVSKEGDGILSDIVRTFDSYLFGGDIYDEKLKTNIKKEGVVSFMYKAVLKDSIVRSVISISLVMYICFYGLAFFMGITDFGKKEIMMRILKLGLVVLFTNEKAWLMYDSLIVKFFKNGMDSMVAMIQRIFELNMEKTLTAISLAEEADYINFDAGRKFIYIDSLIMELTSKPNISRIFGLFWNKTNTGFPVFQFFALIYVPAILALIIYFIYMVLDVALKYLINILKICIGLALGPVFILFSLFEKTKDMFNNWLAFVASRSLEIVILFTMLHPFLLTLDHTFKDMLMFEVCGADVTVGNNFWNYSISYTEDTGRDIFDWFKYFLKIGALIFITKSICDRAGYISGQLISIGGVANADPVSATGRGEGGFNMATSIAKGAFGLAKTALTNSKISQVGKFTGRLMIRNLTKIGRSERLGSINDMVNNAFKAVGIRNRGLRSFMRDNVIDNAFKSAKAEAQNFGLSGADEYNYIRENVGKKLDLFESQNKNKAAMLGLDKKNISKRLDQKLIKEPMKDFIKKQGQDLKNKGIIGKDARTELRKMAVVWANKELGFSEDVAERKVSEFFKKTSVESALKSSSEMTASQAVTYIGNLIATGDDENIKKADEFKDKFRENAIEGKIEKYQQRQENQRTGGVIGKGIVGGINIVGKAMRPIAYLGTRGYRIIRNDKKTADEFYGKFKYQFSKVNLNNRIGKTSLKKLGQLDNEVAKEKDRFFGLLGYAGMDRGKDLRKFDRKLARELSNSEIHEKIKEYNEKPKNPGDAQEFKGPKKPAFVSELAGKEEIIKDRLLIEKLRFKESDGTAKFLGKVLARAILFPADYINKKYHFYRGGEKSEKKEFERLGRESKLSTLREMAKKENDKINGKLLARYQQNLKVDEKTGEVKAEKDKTDALERLDKSKEQRDSMEKVALMMKKMEKTVKDQEKAKEKKEKYIKEQRLEELKRLDSKDEEGKETLFERLSKIEAIAGVSNLKSEFVKKVNEKIDHYSKYLEDEKKGAKGAKVLKASYALEVLKGALFKSVDEVNMDKNSELFNIFKDVVSKAPVDFISAGDPSASAPASTSTSAPTSTPARTSESTSAKNTFKKQEQLLGEFYEGEKTITKVEASGKPPKKRLYTIDEEDEEEEL